MTLCCISLKEKEESYYSDGTCNGERYFTCPAGKGFFTLLSNCQPDSRLGMWYATNNYVVENSSCTALFLCQFRTPVLLLMNNCNYSAHFLSKENMSNNFLSYFCFAWFFFYFCRDISRTLGKLKWSLSSTSASVFDILHHSFILDIFLKLQL